MQHPSMTLRLNNITDPFTILWLTDIHLCECDERNREVSDHMKERKAIFGGNSKERFLSVMEESNLDNISFVAITGDTIDAPTEANIEQFNAVWDNMKVPCGFCFGNHEWHGVSPERREYWYPRFNASQSHSLDIHWFDIHGVRLVFVDDSDYQITQWQLQEAEKALAGQMPCLFFMHIPLYLDSLKEDTIEKWGEPLLLGANCWSDGARERCEVADDSESTFAFRRLMLEHKNVKALFAGHIHLQHKDEFQPGCFQHVLPDSGSCLVKIENSSSNSAAFKCSLTHEA